MLSTTELLIPNLRAERALARRGRRFDIVLRYWRAQQAAGRELELAVGSGLELGFGRLDETFPVTEIGVHRWVPGDQLGTSARRDS
jgi:hypothetical protein